jgi:hypothetical protein
VRRSGGPDGNSDKIVDTVCPIEVDCACIGRTRQSFLLIRSHFFAMRRTGAESTGLSVVPLK